MKTFQGGMRYLKSFDDMTPAHLAHLEEIRVAVRAAALGLPSKQRKAVLLWMEGYSHREIAEAIGGTEAQSRWNVHKGKRAMASALSLSLEN